MFDIDQETSILPFSSLCIVIVLSVLPRLQEESIEMTPVRQIVSPSEALFRAVTNSLKELTLTVVELAIDGTEVPIPRAIAKIMTNRIMTHVFNFFIKFTFPFPFLNIKTYR